MNLAPSHLKLQKKIKIGLSSNQPGINFCSPISPHVEEAQADGYQSVCDVAQPEENLRASHEAEASLLP